MQNSSKQRFFSSARDSSTVLGERLKERRERQSRELDVVMEWVSERLASESGVPRVDDVVRHAYTVLGYRDLKRADIAKRLRLHPAYLMSSSQTRGKKRWKRYRPILANALGHLHGDLGFFAVRREYETPVTFRAGYLILKDVLSRFTYVTILQRSKSAESMVRAFQDVLEQHARFFGPENGSSSSSGGHHRILSIAFDQETSVMSKKVQDFLRDNHIAFHPFQYTASKSKMAEGAIKLVRKAMARLLWNQPKRRWWRLMDKVVAILNNQLIRVNNRTLPWRPVDVNKRNLAQFRRALHKADPVRFFGQYELSSRHVRFKYPEGSIVRPKLIVTSSAVVGEKRSEVSLEADAFVVTRQLAYVNARFEVGRAYRCTNRRTGQEEIFDQDDLAASAELEEPTA